MKSVFVILCFLFISCYQNEHLNNIESEEYKNVYLYDERLVNYSTCVVVGYLERHKIIYYINKNCDILEGNICLGTNNVFNCTDYFVNIKIYTIDSIFYINQNKTMKQYESFYSNHRF